MYIAVSDVVSQEDPREKEPTMEEEVGVNLEAVL